jgi:hypothetical protein
MSRELRRVGGTPIEEAPLWALALLAGVLWLLVFPALVGLADGFGRAPGGGRGLALAAAAISVLLVTGLATRPAWRRPAGPRPHPLDDRRPLVARFSTWLIGVVLYPNLLHGLLVLTRGGEAVDYRASLAIGLVASGIQGLFALRARRRAGKS